MRIKVKGRKLVTEHIWFENFDKDNVIKSKADRICIHANTIAITKQAKLQYSLLTDLRKGAQELSALCSATVRNEVRRAEREGTVCVMFTSRQLKTDNGVLRNFSEMYHAMYAQKGLDMELPHNEIQAYIENDCLLLSMAKVNGMISVFHSYITGGALLGCYIHVRSFERKKTA